MAAKTHCVSIPFAFLTACFFLMNGPCSQPFARQPPQKQQDQAIQKDPAPSLPKGMLVKEFIYEKAGFPSCHASTIEETSEGLIASWFGGTGEGKPDVCIWTSWFDGKEWSPPKQVADGIQNSDLRYPCWNPVLYQIPGGALHLFYKVGPNPRTWWGMVIRSKDGGKTWGPPVRLPDGILGPIKNKPVRTAFGIILAPSSTESDGWVSHVEISGDNGKSWRKVGPLHDVNTFSAIQPTILIHGAGILQLLLRTKEGKIAESWSKDVGVTWEPMQATSLPNPNSGIDAVTLADHRHLLVYNHTVRGRSPLNVAVSEDGKKWKAALPLETESGEYSYPAVIQSHDGKVHITYTWKRGKIRHVVLDPNQLELRDMPGGNWPK